jgi:hypothetical protein
LRAALAPHWLAIDPDGHARDAPERMAKLVRRDAGFVYAVTMTGTTGRTRRCPAKSRVISTGARASKTAGVRGFGIRGREQVEQLAVTWPASSSARRWSKCSKADRMPRRS